ncbi:MAG: hypothetical protein A2342_06580 [Gallionellales bacterium RIFOXYB12_FULL_54_9]|nr:MAG: hypothetical protein A2342_06580 [Gallionellales bacterium RIFOXYB12_FULL_54_9]
MKYIATLTCLLLAAFATPSFAHEHNDCADKAAKIAAADRTAFLKSCLKEAGSPANTAHAKQHDKEQHCDTNAKSMKLEGKDKSEYLDHCYKENDFDKNAKPHPKH